MVVVNILGNTFEDVCDRKKQQLYVKYPILRRLKAKKGRSFWIPTSRVDTQRLPGMSVTLRWLPLWNNNKYTASNENLVYCKCKFDFQFTIYKCCSEAVAKVATLFTSLFVGHTSLVGKCPFSDVNCICVAGRNFWRAVGPVEKWVKEAGNLLCWSSWNVALKQEDSCSSESSLRTGRKAGG